MKFNKSARLLFLLALLVTVPRAPAATIAFGGEILLNVGNTYQEGGFTFEVVSGNQWCQTAGVLSGGCNSVPVVGDYMDVFLTGGGFFTFDQLSILSTVDGSDGMDFHGLVNGGITQQLLNVTTTSHQTLAPGFSAAIDRLRLTISSVGNQPLSLDNLVLTPAASPTPEPATGAVAGLLLGLGWLLQRRR